MTRLEVKQFFRDENPEVTVNVVSDATLNSWLLKANREIAAATFCIQANEPATISSVADKQFYDLENQIDKFYAIDDMPGGGVYYDGTPLKKVSAGEMNCLRKNWRSSESGTPKYYWRRGKYLWFDVSCATADLDILVDHFLIPDDFDSDTKLPFNELEYLIPFHDSLSKYLEWRAMKKLKKYDEAKVAQADYLDYLSWMKRVVGGANQSASFFRPVSSNSGLPRR